MYDFIITLITIVSILLVLIILVQNPKGGLAENFSSNNRIFGASATSNIVEKMTWIFGIALFILVFLANIIQDPKTSGGEKIEESEINTETIEQ